MLIANQVYSYKKQLRAMADSMNFGPEWLRNLSSEGSTGGGTDGGTRYQLAKYRYGREEMLALFEKGVPAPSSLTSFTPLYSEQALLPLALSPPTEDERIWSGRSIPPGPPGTRGRGGPLERGGRISRGRPTYQNYSRGGYEGSGGWGNGEQPDWNPRKEYGPRTTSVDNWRRHRTEDDEGWRGSNHRPHEKWGRSTSWRDEDVNEDRAPPERGVRNSWHDSGRGPGSRRLWEKEDVPEWANDNANGPCGSGSFDASGAFHGSDDELEPMKKDHMLQKSMSQQNVISNTNKQHPSLPTSQSALSLSKPFEKSDTDKIDKSNKLNENSSVPINKIQSDNKNEIVDKNKDKNNIDLISSVTSSQNIMSKNKDDVLNLENSLNNSPNKNNNTNGMMIKNDTINRVQEDIDRMQEEFVLKLVENEDSPSVHPLGGPAVAQPPPNLAPPIQEKWYYQDPQGEVQGPFQTSEMAEWYRAGYFTTTLYLRRNCDERYSTLGELVSLCGGNPFQPNVRIPPIKGDTMKLPMVDSTPVDLLQWQLRQLNLRHHPPATPLAQPTSLAHQTEPWAALTALQQRELLTHHMMASHSLTPEMCLQQLCNPATSAAVNNPIMNIFNQIQQNNKIGATPLPEKTPNPSNITNPQLDNLQLQQLVQQMGGLQMVPGNPGLSSGVLPGTGSLSGVLPPLVNTAPLTTGLGTHPVLAGTQLNPNNSGMPGGGIGLPGGLTDVLPTLPGLDNVNGDSNPIKNLLRQLQQQNQSNAFPTNQQWIGGGGGGPPPAQQAMPPSTVPAALWDLPIPPTSSAPNKTDNKPSDILNLRDTEKEQRLQEMKATAEKEKEKKRLEQEEKTRMLKEMEEKRKEEQRKQEAEKRAQEEKRKKDEERVKRELEKARREAEEKKQKEQEEKKRLKEQRRLEEEMRKKAAEEEKKREEEEKAKREAEQARRQAEALRQMQESTMRQARAAPWCQTAPNTTTGTSLAEIQRAEKERRMAEQMAHQQAQKELQEQQAAAALTKPSTQIGWSKKPMEPRKVKSLAEIQAEEQEKLAKQASEHRMQKEKDRETSNVTNTSTPGIWGSQNLSWANTCSANLNSSNHNTGASGGFWDEPSHKSPAKNNQNVTAASVVKSNSTNSMPNKQAAKTNKNKNKKEEQQVMKLFNGPADDEFTTWCINSLKDINSGVDIPTFVTFLRDIESAYEVRDYAREYLGDGPAAQQFTQQFLERRRNIKARPTQHKDDMCIPAPAITPAQPQHQDFQEVKGKGKKIKKSKMLKVDNRILGFSVTASEDRINVGERELLDL